MRHLSISCMTACLTALLMCFAVPVAAVAPETATRPFSRPLDPDLPPGFVSERPIPRPATLLARAQALWERERQERIRTQNANSTANTRINTAATVRSAIVVDGMALIGVFGTNESRRALLRMPDGGFVRISRGATIDGWRVIAVGEDTVRLLRGGETQVLNLP